MLIRFSFSEDSLRGDFLFLEYTARGEVMVEGESPLRGDEAEKWSSRGSDGVVGDFLEDFVGEVKGDFKGDGVRGFANSVSGERSGLVGDSSDPFDGEEADGSCLIGENTVCGAVAMTSFILSAFVACHRGHLSRSSIEPRPATINASLRSQ